MNTSKNIWSEITLGTPFDLLEVGSHTGRSWEPPYHMHQTESPWDSDALLKALLPRYQYAFEKFGPDRCMFESNFPVDKDCVSYRTLWNLFKKMAERLGLSESEKQSVFSGTAARAYRLEAP